MKHRFCFSYIFAVVLLLATSSSIGQELTDEATSLFYPQPERQRHPERRIDFSANDRPMNHAYLLIPNQSINPSP